MLDTTVHMCAIQPTFPIMYKKKKKKEGGGVKSLPHQLSNWHHVSDSNIIPILIQRELVTVMVRPLKLGQNIVFCYLYNDKDLTAM